MIQEDVEIETQDNPSIVLQEYKQINKHLRRKIKEKDLKIMQLFNCIDEASKQLTASPQSQLVKSNQHRERSVKLTMSENNKRGKENVYSSNIESGNIFKQQSFSLMGKDSSKKQLHLPALERRSKFIYPAEDSIIENPEMRAKVVRIPLDRLKPLNSKQVKKRFLLKYQRKEVERTQIS